MAAEELIARYGLQPHPEGGFFKETHRCPTSFARGGDGATRNLTTSIYYLLRTGDKSALHRIKSEELWFHHAGDALSVFELLPGGGVRRTLVGAEAPAVHFHAVPADTYFGSTLEAATGGKHGFVLVSCVVAPGFDFADWAMESAAELRKAYPGPAAAAVIQLLAKDAAPEPAPAPAAPPAPPAAAGASLLGARSVGFIGAGNMATALVQGLLARGVCAPAQLRVASPSGPSAALRALGVGCGSDNRAVAAASDVLVLAVKPFKLAEVVAALGASEDKGVAGAFKPGCVIVSIASGVSTTQLEAMLKKAGYYANTVEFPMAGGLWSIKDQVVLGSAWLARNPCPRVLRVMPNTPAQVLAGASALCPGARSSREDLALVRELFEAVGAVAAVEEKHMDGVTGLSGSGPAYVMLFIEALADGGVASGLPRPTAMALALQLVKGAAQMAQQTGQHPGALKDAVASPGGTTIAGVHALEVGAFRGTVMSAVVAASKRAAELGAAERV